LSDRLDQVRQKRQRLEEQIKAVEEPLQNIEKFRKSRRLLSVKRNRDALRQLLEELRAVDSCHPELERYKLLLERFER
jgi:septal ring factor EnvC (AmiA/AmiB activator)